MPVFMKGHIQHAPLSKVNTEQQSKPASQKRLLKEKYIIFLAGAPLFPHTQPCPAGNWELKQQRRRRLRKRHLKSEFALPQTLSRLFYLV